VAARLIYWQALQEVSLDSVGGPGSLIGGFEVMLMW
jgi:hypothetical protein